MPWAGNIAKTMTSNGKQFTVTHEMLTAVACDGWNLSGKQNSLFPSGPVIKCLLLYSWRFSRYSASIHWLVHGHMTSNNETVSRQMPWAGNIAKAMTSNGKQFTVNREMLTAVARDPWNLSALSKFAFVLFCYITNHLMTGPLGNSEFCFPRISMFPSTSSRETLIFSGNKIHCSPRNRSLSVKYFPESFISSRPFPATIVQQNL